MDNDCSKLSVAAEELVKVARSMVEDESLFVCKESLEVLNKLSTVASCIETAVESLKTLVESKLDSLTESVKDLTAFQHRTYNLECAISRSESDDYYSSLVVSILKSFRMGRPHVVDNYINCELISNQIYDLTGQTPVIEMEGNSTTIYYS